MNEVSKNHALTLSCNDQLNYKNMEEDKLNIRPKNALV